MFHPVQSSRPPIQLDKATLTQSWNSKLIDPECCIKDEELNKKTAFYKFRRTLNDTRKWGLPLHIIRVINQKNIEIFVIKGESKKDEVIDFLDKNLP